MNAQAPTAAAHPIDAGDHRQLAARQILLDYELETFKPMPAAELFLALEERWWEAERLADVDLLIRGKRLRLLAIEGIVNCTIEATRPEPCESGFKSLATDVAIRILETGSLAEISLRLGRNMLLQTIQAAGESELAMSESPAPPRAPLDTSPRAVAAALNEKGGARE